MNILISLLKRITRILIQHMLEDLFLGIHQTQQLIGVHLLSRRVQDSFNTVFFARSQIILEFLQAITHVNKYRLLCLLQEEFMLGVFASRVGHVPKVLIAEERVQEDVIHFHVQSQWLFDLDRHGW